MSTLETETTYTIFTYNISGKIWNLTIRADIEFLIRQADLDKLILVVYPFIIVNVKTILRLSISI